MKNRRAIVFFLACSAVFALALALAWTYRRAGDPLGSQCGGNLICGD